jgi:hypothetical protein
MQTNTVININSDANTVPVEHQGRFQLACKCKILMDNLQQKSIAAMLESDDLSLDEAARENKLIVALDYENKAEEYGRNIEKIMSSINKAMEAVQEPAVLTLREQMQKIYGHVKINGNNLKLLEWKSAGNEEAYFASAERALKYLEMTLLEILGQNKNHLDLFYPLLITEALTLEQKVWFKETFKGHDGRSTTWKEFQQAFADRFSPSPYVCKDLHRLMELTHMRMIPGRESIEEYIIRFRDAFEEISEATGMIDNYVVGHMFIESLPARLQQAVYQQVMLSNRRSRNVGDPMDVDITNAVPSKTARGSELLMSLSHAVAQAKNCNLLAGLNLLQNDPSNDMMAPPYTPDFIRELGYVNTMVKTSSNSVGRKGIFIQGRAGFPKVALNQIEEQTAEHGMPSIITGRGNSHNSSFVNAGHADSFKGRRSEPTPMKVTNNAASDNQPGFIFCQFHQRQVRHTTEECELNPNKQDKRLCKYKCGSAYTTGHNYVCEKRQANKDKTMPSVASVQVQDPSAVSTKIVAAGPYSVTKKRKAKQALLPQCDIDRSNSSRRLYKGKSKLVYRQPTQGREVRVYGLKAQQYAAAVRDQEERDLAERKNNAQATLLAMPSTSSTRAMPTASRENIDHQVVEHNKDIECEAKLVQEDIIAANVDLATQRDADYYEIDMDGDIVIDKPPFNSDSSNNPTLNGSCLEDLDAELQELSEECKSKTAIYAKIAVNASAIDQNTNCPYFNVPVTVENVRTMATVDSGATTSILSPKLVSLLSLPITPVKGSIKLAASEIQVPRIGTVNKVNFCHNGIKTKHNFEIMEINHDLSDIIIGTDLMTKIGIGLTGLATSWNTSSGPRKADPVLEENLEPNNSPYGSTDEHERFMQQLQLSIQANERIPLISWCTIPESVIHLPTEKGKTAYRRQYPIPEKLKTVLQEQIEQWLQEGVIRVAPVNTDFNNPITCATKKDLEGNYTGIRVCLDPRALNLLLPDDRFPIPLVKDVFRSMGKSKVFTTLDLRQAFHRFKLAEEDQHKTSFTVDGQVYCFVSCPFGLKSISSCFQRVMNKIFDGCDYVTVFVDDVLVHSDNLQDHACHVQDCIDRLTAVNLILNVNKCHFAQKSVYLLGFSLSAAGVSLDQRKVTNAYEWPVPTTGKHIMRFLGFANYFRDHIPKFSDMTHRLDKLRNEGDITHVWTQQLQQDFENIKSALSSAPVLSIPQMDHPFFVATDASAFSIGGVIYQVINETYKYIGFAARSLSISEKNYSCTKRELLGIVFMLRRFHQYLWGNPFTLITDHKALCYLQTQTIANPMMVGWLDIICDYTYEVVHLPGILNVIPDALSRLFGEESDFTRQQSLTAATNDSVNPASRLEGGKIGSSSKTKCSNKPKAYLESVNATAPAKEEYMTPPQDQRKKILLETHLFGHFGANSMITKIHNDGMHWKNIKEEALDIVKECEQCLQFNLGSKAYRPLTSIMADAPGDHWAIDLGTLNVTSSEGSNYIMVMVDIFSRFCVIRAIPDKTAVTVAKEVIKVFCDFGFPKILQSDNGTEFVNQILQHVVKHCGIDHRLTLPYNPRANGVAEKWVGTVKRTLVKQLEGNKADWEKYLPAVQLAINCKYASIHGSRPFSIMFAREPNDLKDYSQVESTSSEPSTENNNAILKRINDMSRIIVPIIKDRSITTQQAQQKKFNAKRNVIETDYPVGTLVMVSDVLKRATTDPSYTGPFTVHSITKRHNYILRDSMNNITNPYPIQRLKLAGGESIPVAKDVSDIYEVQSVVNHKADPTNTRKYIYRVRWKGSPDPSEDTWEEVQHFSSLKPIEEYWNRRNSNYAEPNSKAVITQRKRTASSIPTPDQGAEQGPSTYTRKGKRVRNSTINVADLRKAKLL